MKSILKPESGVTVLLVDDTGPVPVELTPLIVNVYAVLAANVPVTVLGEVVPALVEMSPTVGVAVTV